MAGSGTSHLADHAHRRIVAAKMRSHLNGVVDVQSIAGNDSAQGGPHSQPGGAIRQDDERPVKRHAPKHAVAREQR
jgi:hypothetical protein